MTTSSHAAQDVEGADQPEADLSIGDDAAATPPSDWFDSVLVEAEGPRRLPALIGMLAFAAVIGVGVLMAVRPAPGTTLIGQPVASVADGQDAVDAAEGRLAQLDLQIQTPAGTSVAVAPADLGLVIDREAAVAGLQPGTASISNWFRRLTNGPRTLPMPLDLVSDELAQSVAADLTLAPEEPDVTITQTEVLVDAGADGLDVTADEVSAAVERAMEPLLTADPTTWPATVDVDVVGTTAPPILSQADIDALRAQVAAINDVQVRVEARVRPDDASEDRPDPDGAADAPDRVSRSLTLSEHTLLQMLQPEVDLSAPEGQRLQVVASTLPPPASLFMLMEQATVPPTVDAFIENRSPTPKKGEGDPEDVSEVTGDIVLEDVDPGFTPDPDLTAQAIVEAAKNGGGAVDVVGVENPDVTPESLGITEPISTFTTYYTAGQSRVTNIRRMAELVDGVVIPPGESFELNRHVGRRTSDKGFVGGGAIQEGELVNELGGGVSQFATTFFNAAWFAGVELVDFKAHSVYFGRYPPGREATVNWPTVNLEIRNDTPHAILVDTDSNTTSVTVTFWSTPYWDVETIMGPCGCGGSFRITNQRILTSPNGTRVEEEYETVYTVLRD